MKKILVLGGSGFVGRHFCEKLATYPFQITVPTRQDNAVRHLDTLPRLRRVFADVHHLPTLTGLLAGHDAVVNLVAELHGNADSFERVHVELPRKIVQACASTGVQRVLHVSALGLDAAQPQAMPSLYLRSKAQGEALLRAAPLALTVLRPSVIFGEYDHFLNLFARLQRLLPVMPLAGADARFQPVWVEDVAAALLRCLQDDASIGKIYELAGPQVFTLRELVQLAGRYAGINHGCGRPVLALPPALGRLQALLMEFAPGPTLLSRDSLASMSLPSVVGSGPAQLPGLEALGIHATALAAVAPGWLGQLQSGYGLNALRRTAGRF